MSEKKMPKIRFPEFTGDWEQRKFRELYKKSSEKNDGSIGIEKNITVATMQFKEDVQVSTEEYLKTYYKFNVGDIAFEGHQSKEFRFGRFVENDIGNGIVSHIFAVFRPIVDYDLKFWKYAINNERLMQRVLSRSTKSSTMMHDLVTDDFLEQTFLVPNIKEQIKIGEFLSNLDNLITLHQRKCNKIKEYKKGCLHKIFSQEVRFKRDDGTDFPEWDDTTLGNLEGKVSSGKDKNEDGNVPLYGSMGQIGTCAVATHIGNKILVSRVGANSGSVRLVTEDCGVTDNTLIIKDTASCNFSWLYYALVDKNIGKMRFGSGQPLVTGTMLFELEIEAPCLE